jgi:hypothetical protein
MEQFKYDDWYFEFDRDTTQEYYKNNKYICDCPMCRNYRDNVHMMPDNVKKFLEQFGIDILSPIEHIEGIIDGKQVEQQVVYVVNGMARSDTGYEIDIGLVQIVIDKEYIFESKIQQPCFYLTIYNMYFPYTIKDDIGECFSRDKSIWERLRQIFKK